MGEKVSSDNHGLMKINQRPMFIVQDKHSTSFEASVTKHHRHRHRHPEMKWMEEPWKEQEKKETNKRVEDLRDPW